MLNAANEVAVSSFLEGRLGFTGIPGVIEQTMDAHTPEPADHIGRSSAGRRLGPVACGRAGPGVRIRCEGDDLTVDHDRVYCDYAFCFLFVLGVLVFIHELGHFLLARWHGVRVITFSLGFGPKMLKVQRGDTEYCIEHHPARRLREDGRRKPGRPARPAMTMSSWRRASGSGFRS